MLFSSCYGSESRPSSASSQVRELQAEVSRLEQELFERSAEITNLKRNLQQRSEMLARPLPGPKDADAEVRSVEAAPVAFEDKQAQIAAVHARVEKGFLRKDEATLRTIFDRYLQGASTQHADLLAALREFNPSLDRDDLIEMERTASVNSKAPISFEHFKLLINLPSKVEQWVQSLPMSALLGDAISALISTSHDLRPVGELTLDQIASVSQGLVKGLERMLTEHVRLLQVSYTAMDAKAMQAQAASASKFQVVKMSCGAIDDYHAGIEGRTGFPNMQFDKSMAIEHCFHKSSNTPFKTSNYNITTTTREEWEYVVDRKPCPDSMLTHGRKIKDLNALLKLKIVMEAKLSKVEVISVVLYTGPMFVVFNAILRRYPADIYNLFGDEGKGFSTSIFVLVSAVQKLSRSEALPDGLVLYRGLGGTLDLPDSFFQSDSKGCKGYAEWGFMSTTAKKEVALQYSGVKEGKPCATVLVIRVGAVDRGACIQEMSQYPGEEEYIWLPCSWLAPRGGTIYEVTGDGVVRMVLCDVRANLKAVTSEELVTRKKHMHLTAFRYSIDELARQLRAIAEEKGAEARLQRDNTRNQRGTWTVEGFVDGIVEECKIMIKRHEAVEASEYTEEARFRGLSLEVAETTHMALSKLHYWLDDPSGQICFLQGKGLRAVHRQRVAFLTRLVASERGYEERRVKALEVCKVKGLVEREVEERNELGETRLLSAAADGRAPADIHLLSAAGADLSSRDREGATPLHAAAGNGHVDVVSTLVSLNAEIEATESMTGSTALFLAARHGHVGCVNVLAKAKADVKASMKDGASPIYIAAQNGHAEAVRALMEGRADVNAKRNDGWSPINSAASKGHLKAVRVLMESNADILAQDYDGWSPINSAASKGHKEVVQELMKGKANVDTKSIDGWSPINSAAQHGHVQTVRVLMEGKADLNAKNNNGFSPVCMAAKNGHVEVLRVLIKGKANIDAKDNDAATPLFWAASSGHLEAMRVLMEGKADVLAKRKVPPRHPFVVCDFEGFDAMNVAELEEAFVCFVDVRVPLNQATISTRELPSLIRSLNRNPSQADLQAICNEIDARGEGTINFQTFLQIMQRQFPPAETIPEIVTAFEAFDRSKSGLLKDSEFATVMRSFGEPLTDEEVDAVLVAAEPFKRGDMIDYRAFARHLAA